LTKFPSNAALDQLFHDLENEFNSGNNVKIWKSDLSLTWNDFQGLPSGLNEHTAWIHSIMYPQWKTQIETDNENYRFLSINAITISRKDKSWVSSIGQCDAALRHEQGHFDITENYTRMFNDESSKKLLDKIFPIPYGNGPIETRMEKDAKLKVMTLYYLINENRKTAQKNYEEKTENGTNFSQQSIAEAAISDMLSK